MSGPEVELENTPVHIDAAIAAGFDAEIDLWGKQGGLFLGHDGPDHSVTMEWLEQRANSVWVHCKNAGAISAVGQSDLNWFYHNQDDYTLTSKGFLWAYPGRELPQTKVVALHFGKDFNYNRSLYGAHAVCGDYVGLWSAPQETRGS